MLPLYEWKCRCLLRRLTRKRSRAFLCFQFSKRPYPTGHTLVSHATKESWQAVRGELLICVEVAMRKECGGAPLALH